MKKIMKALFVLLTTSLLFSCNEGGGNKTEPPEGVKMTASLIEMGDKMLVEVLESEYTSGPHLVITSSDTVFVDKDGKKISKSDLKPADKLEIIYGGQVMMSLPPQIVAKYVKKL